MSTRETQRIDARPPSSGLVIETRGVTKRFGSHVAVDDVDLHVAEGARYGFLGPNGSGKTTMVRMLLGLVYATRGEITVLGATVPNRVADVLPEIGAMVEGPAAYPHLSGRTNLALLDASGPRRGRDGSPAPAGRGGPRARRARRGRPAPVRTYSLGMRQRLGLAGALLNRPRLLVLDEPTNGLDPHGIREVRDLLIELNAAGTTVFLSSHLLAEIEALCTTVGVVDRGRLVLEDALDAVRGPTGRLVVRTPDPDGAARLLGRAVAERHDHTLVVDAAPGGPSALARHLVEHGVPLDGLAEQRRSLEDVVVALTGPGSDTARTGEARA